MAQARAATPVLSPHERSRAVQVVGPAAVDAGDAEEDGTLASTPTLEDAPPAFDAAAEAAFLGEAKERGEVVVPRPAEEVEESDPKVLPPLEDLVNRIPAEVRDVLEDLFRARFVSVKRFPKKVLKQN